MATNPVPTLDRGWLYDPEPKADFLMACYFTSDYSQSNLYEGNISSLQYQIQQWGTNESLLISKMSAALEAYLIGYFDKVNAIVSVNASTQQGDSRLQVQVNVTVTQAGVSYSLGRLVSFLNSKIIAIMNLNNGTNNALVT